MAVKMIDNSIAVKAALDETTTAWLYEWGATIASDAKANTKLDGDEGITLRKSYDYRVEEEAGKATIGSTREAAFWEEYGTGEYAVHGDGRKGWWLYIEGQDSGKAGRMYETKEDAEQMAAYIKAKYGKTAIVTNGRRPAKTLEGAFAANKERSIKDLEKKLGRSLGE